MAIVWTAIPTGFAVCAKSVDSKKKIVPSYALPSNTYLFGGGVKGLDYR
jgi:hypothetical protein